MIKLEIDGKQLEVKPGTMIIEAADNAAIPIPRFCYHKKLSIAANCRMCLVEVVKAPKPLPACATPVTEGMVVHTKSAVALMAQRSVMEFLLINHPLDCPVCDQGGECELQDLSMGYGKDISRFNRGKRSVKDENIGPLIATGMTRCIHCTRCVRFGEEIAGFKELGAVNRGEHLEIRSFLNSSIDSELSGNMIDVCPVGALTSKPYRFSARTWELQQRPSIAPHDCVGSNINVHSLRNNIKRVVPCENELINEVWLSDRDRFSYEGLNHAEKLLHPMVRENGVLVQSSWEKALNCAAEYIKAQVDLNPNDLITLLSPSSTVEEGYLLQKITRELGSDNVDFRLKNNNNLADLFSDNIAVKLADLEQADSFLIFGACPRKSVPLLNHRIRKAVLKGAKVNVINPVGEDWNYNINLEQIVEPELLLAELKNILNNLNSDSDSDSDSGSDSKSIAENLKNSKNPVIIIGQLALSHPDWDKLYQVLLAIKKKVNAGLLAITDGANSLGLYSVGAMPKNIANTNIATVFSRANQIGTYLLFNIEPEYDCYQGIKAVEKLKSANKVVCFSPFLSETMAEYADIVLPTAAFTETSGTFVNLEGVWQSFSAVIAGQKDSEVRPGWKILSALAQLLNLSGDQFNYQSSLEVKQAALDLVALSSRSSTKCLDLGAKDLVLDRDNNTDEAKESFVSENNTATLICETNCYQADNIVRRAKSLQQTHDAKQSKHLAISKHLAEKLELSDSQFVNVTVENNNKYWADLPVVINNKLPDNCVYLLSGNRDTLSINWPYSKVIISK